MKAPGLGSREGGLAASRSCCGARPAPEPLVGSWTTAGEECVEEELAGGAKGKVLGYS